MYGYTFAQIADMNRFQQLSLLKGEEKMHFSNYDEYMKWKASHG